MNRRKDISEEGMLIGKVDGGVRSTLSKSDVCSDLRRLRITDQAGPCPQGSSSRDLALSNWWHPQVS
jgi:hypothetical protein